MRSLKRWLSPRLVAVLAVVAALPLLPVQAATIYTSSVLISNPSDDDLSGEIIELGVSGAGLKTLQSDLYKVSVQDNSGNATIWEVRDDATSWRALVPSTVAAKGTTGLSLKVDDTSAVDVSGAWAYVTTPQDSSNQQPGSSSFSLKARAYVGPLPKPKPTTLANGATYEQYPSSNRMAEVDGTLCMAYISGSSALVKCSTDLGATWGASSGVSISSYTPKQVSLTGKNGYLHMAVYASSSTTQKWYYVRGALNGGAVSWGTPATVDTQTGSGLLTQGVSIILAGTNRDQPSILYAYTSSTATLIKRRYSTASDTWTSPATTTAVSVSTSIEAYMVAQVPHSTTTHQIVAIYGPRVAGTIGSHLAGTSFSNSVDLPNATGTYTASPFFSCSEKAGGSSTSIRVYCAIRENDGDLSLIRRTYYSPAAWSTVATIKSGVSGLVYPTLTYVSQFPHPLGDAGAFIVTWTESDERIHQAYRIASTASIQTYDYARQDRHVLLASGAIDEGLTSPPYVSNSARFGLGAHSASGQVVGYSMPPLRGAILSYGENYGLFLEPDGQITATVGKWNVSATTIGYQPAPGIYDVEANLTWGSKWELLLEGVSVRSTAYTNTSALNASNNNYIVSHGWMAEDIILELAGVEKTKWFGEFSEENGIYKTNDLTSNKVGTVKQFFPPSQSLLVDSGPLKPLRRELRTDRRRNEHPGHF